MFMFHDDHQTMGASQFQSTIAQLPHHVQQGRPGQHVANKTAAELRAFSSSGGNARVDSMTAADHQ
jgi:hypothetical protein